MSLRRDQWLNEPFILKALRNLQQVNRLFLIGCFSFDEINKSCQIYYSKAPLFFQMSKTVFFGGYRRHQCDLKAKMIRHCV